MPVALLAVLLCLWTWPAQAAWALLGQDGAIIMIRHGATGGGTGDPDGFRLEDCATQRNLNDRGREQAGRWGEAFRRNGVRVAGVLSSRWCRAMDTARLAFGEATAYPALDNLFQRPAAAAGQMADLRGRMLAFRGPGVLVMVTHGSVITRVGGGSPPEAGAVIYRREGDDIVAVGRLPPP